jgi:hypothetical protein
MERPTGIQAWYVDPVTKKGKNLPIVCDSKGQFMLLNTDKEVQAVISGTTTKTDQAAVGTALLVDNLKGSAAIEITVGDITKTIAKELLLKKEDLTFPAFTKITITVPEGYTGGYEVLVYK